MIFSSDPISCEQRAWYIALPDHHHHHHVLQLDKLVDRFSFHEPQEEETNRSLCFHTSSDGFHMDYLCDSLFEVIRCTALSSSYTRDAPLAMCQTWMSVKMRYSSVAWFPRLCRALARSHASSLMSVFELFCKLQPCLWCLTYSVL